MRNEICFIASHISQSCSHVPSWEEEGAIAWDWTTPEIWQPETITSQGSWGPLYLMMFVWDIVWRGSRRRERVGFIPAKKSWQGGAQAVKGAGFGGSTLSGEERAPLPMCHHRDWDIEPWAHGQRTVQLPALPLGWVQLILGKAKNSESGSSSILYLPSCFPPMG
jgi:hypothetical protein